MQNIDYCQKQECPAFFDKEPQPVMWAGLRTICVKITLSNASNLLNTCAMCRVSYTYNLQM
jgi:hypothetical protein